MAREPTGYSSNVSLVAKPTVAKYSPIPTIAIGSEPLYPIEIRLEGVRLLELGPEASLELLGSSNIGAILYGIE